MFKHLTSACTFMVLMTFLSCSETSNPTKPDDSGNNNNNNSQTKRIAYITTTGEKDSNSVIWVVDINGANKREIIRGKVFFGSAIHNEKMVIREDKYDNSKQMRVGTLYLYDLKTNTKEVLLQNSFTTKYNKYSNITSQICLSQDGKKVCFVMDSVDGSNIGSGKLFIRHYLKVIDLETKSISVLTDDVAREQKLNISPDGKFIAYYGGWVDSQNPTDKLYVAALDGTIKKQVIGEVSYANDNFSSLVWSSDNKYLITNDPTLKKFQLIERSSWQIERTLEFPEFERVGDVDFSGDNSEIYFTGVKSENGTSKNFIDVFSYELKTAKISRLLHNKVNELNFAPKVSGDGTALLFSSVLLTGTETDYHFFRTLHTMNLKDSSVTTLPDKSTYIYNWVE